MTAVVKTQSHLPKQACLPSGGGQKIWDVEGVTPLAVLPIGLPVGVKEEAPVIVLFLY